MLAFWPSFCQSLAIIFVSEIADRTFILELLYYPKVGAIPLLITATFAMGIMDLLAICVGYLLPMLLLREIVDWIGFAAFTLFGLFSIYEFTTMEKTTVAEEIEKHNKEKDEQYVAIQDNETGASTQQVADTINEEDKKEGDDNKEEDTGLYRKCIELFGFLCISEIGDKSEIATVSIAAMYDLLGVIAGTMMAYTMTCCMAIFLGRTLQHCISEKTMNLIGGIIFLLFALQILLTKFGILA